MLIERSADVEMMARVYSKQARRSDDIDRYLRWMNGQCPAYLWLGVADKHGRLVASTETGLVEQDHGWSDWFLEARDRRGPVVGDAEPYGAVRGVETIAFSAPIFGPSGDFGGAVTTRVGLAAFEKVATKAVVALRAGNGGQGPIE